MSRLVVVSNRVPHDKIQPGGLAVALEGALQQGEGLWCGWSGDIVKNANEIGYRQSRRDGVDYLVTDLSEAEHQGYYLGYANNTLWPCFHFRLDLAGFDDDEFAAYQGVNDRFAELLASVLRKDDVVWVQDYHFLTLARALRRRGCNNQIGFFLHIPFPSPEIFRAIPQSQKLARALADYDVIGFQSQRDTENFRRYLVEEEAANMVGFDSIGVFGRQVKVQTLPISIDAEEYAATAIGEPAKTVERNITRSLDGRALILGVDRMDYSKGLPQRLIAVDAFFERHPHWLGKATFVQIAPPSRSDVKAYASLGNELDRLVGKVNGRHGDLDWSPVRYLPKPFDRADLAGMYRHARVGLVTPLHDGMNLVAKEFVAAQNPSDPGVLVLSEFAGAAEQLGAALIVNPHDKGAVAAAIERGLTMSLAERRQRHAALWAVLKHRDLSWWVQSWREALQPRVPQPTADAFATAMRRRVPTMTGVDVAAAASRVIAPRRYGASARALVEPGLAAGPALDPREAAAGDSRRGREASQ